MLLFLQISLFFSPPPSGPLLLNRSQFQIVHLGKKKLETKVFSSIDFFVIKNFLKGETDNNKKRFLVEANLFFYLIF
jgi:hypothetical protein